MLLLFGGTPVFCAAQDPNAETAPPIFRMEVALVNVDARVSDGEGKDISGLTADDFVVYDEGERQKITNFGQEATPVSVFLVLDVSPEMRPQLLDLTPKVTEALEPLRKGDRAGAMLFAARSEVIQPLTADLEEIPRKVVDSIYKTRYGRDTFVNEGLVDAARYLHSIPVSGRRAVIIITTNRGVRHLIPDDQVIHDLHAADAVLNAIIVGPAAGPRTIAAYHDPASTPPDVYRYAKETGGDVVTGHAPAAALRRLIAQAMTRYTLQYPSPSGASGFRHIRVELAPAARMRYPRAQVQARSGYDTAK